VTPAVRPTGTWDGRAFGHEAFVFSTDDEVVARCLPFVDEGLARGEAVVVVAGVRVRSLLEDALGDRLGQLASFDPAEGWWRGGHETLQAYDSALQQLQATGRPWRLIGEPAWLADKDGRVWSRFEAAVNRCYAHLRYYSLCLHDRRALTPAVVDVALATHPLTWGGSGPVPSPQYVGTDAYLRSVEPPWTQRPPDALRTDVTWAPDGRTWVREVVDRQGWRGRGAEIVLAVHELVTNALRAGGRAEVSTWPENGWTVWEVADSGPGLHDPVAGYVPPATDTSGGRGLWLARSLADDASVAAAGPGTRLRLYFRP
jgi:anti-sigma regulatory factor (Ser/Thr protein kinase)